MLRVGLTCVFLICELFLFTRGCNDRCIMADTSCVDLSYICKQRIYSDVCNAACNNEAVPNNHLSCKYKGKDVNFIEYFNHFNGINDPVICPKMIVPPPSPVNLTIDSTNVKVSCSTKGTNKPVQYFKNGVELQKEVNNGQLLFPKVDESIKGIYTCGVINDENRRSSNMFEIRVNTPPKLNLTMIPKSPKKDDDVKLYCNISAGIPVPNLTWKFNGKEVKQVERYSKYSVFRIATFQPCNSGKYECIGKNVAGIATEQIEYTINPPKLSLTMIPKSPKKADNVTLYCNIIEGIPVPYFTWKFNGKEVKQAERYSKYSVFRIASFQPSNSGIYECIVKNVAGIATAQINYTLNSKRKHHYKELSNDEKKKNGDLEMLLKDAIKNLQDKFEKAMKNLQDKFENAIKNLQDKFENAIKNLQDKFEKAMKNMIDRLKDEKKKKENLEKLLKYEKKINGDLEKQLENEKKKKENLEKLLKDEEKKNGDLAKLLEDEKKKNGDQEKQLESTPETETQVGDNQSKP